jgi:hypothetical protein
LPERRRPPGKALQPPNGLMNASYSSFLNCEKNINFFVNIYLFPIKKKEKTKLND